MLEHIVGPPKWRRRMFQGAEGASGWGGGNTARTDQRNVPSFQSVDDGKCPTVHSNSNNNNNAANVSTMERSTE